MSTIVEVADAEARMNSAKEALLHYIESNRNIDRDLHQRLVARLKRAQDRFMRTVSELGE